MVTFYREEESHRSGDEFDLNQVGLVLGICR